MQIKNNKLHIGNISAEELINKFGSPLYVYDEEIIRKRFNELKNSIKYRNLRIYYACKANTNLSILKILKEEGSYMDAVSPGEIYLALNAGFKPEQILFTCNNPTDEDLKFAIDNKIMINIDSLSELERVGKLNENSKICIRINPDVGAGHHDHCITGGPDSKFGIYFDKISEIKDIAKKYNLKIVGLHEHIGSGILDANKFILAMNVLLKVAKEFNNLEFIDFGGGIGIPYKENDKPIKLKEFGEKVGILFSNFCKDYGKELILAIEPGRYIVAEAGILLATANTIKKTPKHKFVGVDSGFNHLIRPMAYGSYHKIINAGNCLDKKEKYIVCGNLCESGDVFTRNENGIEDREISKINEGDVLAILNAGAYGFSMSSNYNSRLKPVEVIVNNGKARIIREREKFEDLVKYQ